MRTASRYLIALYAGGSISFLLFALMIGLIKISEQPVSGDGFEMVSFIQSQPDPSLQLEALRPAPPPPPEVPPQTTALQLSTQAVAVEKAEAGGTGAITDSLSFTEGLDAGAGGFGSGLGEGSGLGSGFGDGLGGGDYLPIVQVPPVYPPSALQQRIEGWVLVEFTIGTEGQVKNPRVVAAEPVNVFEQSALDAVQRFRFRPRLMGSQPVEVTGVQNRIRFRLMR